MSKYKRETDVVAELFMDPIPKEKEVEEKIEPTQSVKADKKPEAAAKKIKKETTKGTRKVVPRGYEKRDKQISVSITNSTYEKLKELTDDGVIKSTNSIINELLEGFIKKNS